MPSAAGARWINSGGWLPGRHRQTPPLHTFDTSSSSDFRRTFRWGLRTATFKFAVIKRIQRAPAARAGPLLAAGSRMGWQGEDLGAGRF